MNQSKICMAILALAACAVNASAAGFDAPKDPLETMQQQELEKFKPMVGKHLYMYPQNADACNRHPIIDAVPVDYLTKPNRYRSESPVGLTVEAVVNSKVSSFKFYRIRLDTGAAGFIEANYLFTVAKSPHELGFSTVCYATFSPVERDEALAGVAREQAEAEAQRVASKAKDDADELERDAARVALAKKPPVRIGMTAKQVREQTSFGEPVSVNRTTTSKGVREQWVYPSDQYLYFENGRLTAIQN